MLNIRYFFKKMTPNIIVEDRGKNEGRSTKELC